MARVHFFGWVLPTLHFIVESPLSTEMFEEMNARWVSNDGDIEICHDIVEAEGESNEHRFAYRTFIRSSLRFHREVTADTDAYVPANGASQFVIRGRKFTEDMYETLEPHPAGYLRKDTGPADLNARLWLLGSQEEPRGGDFDIGDAFPPKEVDEEKHRRITGSASPLTIPLSVR